MIMTLFDVEEYRNENVLQSRSSRYKSTKDADTRVDRVITPILHRYHIGVRRRTNILSLEVAYPVNDPWWNTPQARFVKSAMGGSGLLYDLYSLKDSRMGIISSVWIVPFDQRKRYNRPCFNIPTGADFEITYSILCALDIYQLTVRLDRLGGPDDFWFCKYSDIEKKYWKTTYRNTKTKKQDRIIFDKRSHMKKYLKIITCPSMMGRQHHTCVLAQQIRNTMFDRENQNANHSS